MTIPNFTSADFAAFLIEGLEPRMAAIRERIQPKFQIMGHFLRDQTALLAGNEMHLHIARHARRKVNAPKDTWLAICDNKRGYKQHPHFQLGLFDDHLFVWFAMIYEVPNKKAIAEAYLRQIQMVRKTIPKHYMISLDHTNKAAQSAESFTALEFRQALERLRDVQKSELLIGRHFSANDPILLNGDAFLTEVNTTIETLFPLYSIACHA